MKRRSNDARQGEASMSPRPSMSKVLAIIPALALGLSVALTHPGNGPAFAESYPSDAPAQPAKAGALGKVKTKSKETWADMKARWAKQKDRWAECQKQEKAEKRSRTASREFLEGCMTGQ